MVPSHLTPVHPTRTYLQLFHSPAKVVESFRHARQLLAVPPGRIERVLLGNTVLTLEPVDRGHQPPYFPSKKGCRTSRMDGEDANTKSQPDNTIFGDVEQRAEGQA